jgi:hypothetical protein
LYSSKTNQLSRSYKDLFPKVEKGNLKKLPRFLPVTVYWSIVLKGAMGKFGNETQDFSLRTQTY